MYAVDRSCFNSLAVRESTPDSYSSDSSLFNTDDSNDELADKITTLAGQINAANYRFLKLIAEFDRRKAWVGAGIRSCAYWLSWKCGLDMNAAREKVRVARALEGLPGINAGFEKGALSYSKVRAMTRVATELNESYLLMIAEHGTTQHVEKLAGAFRTVSRAEEFPGEDVMSVVGEVDESVVVSDVELERRREQNLYESRCVSCYQDEDGMWIIKAKLPAEAGGLVVKVLKELGDRIKQEAGSSSEEANKEGTNKESTNKEKNRKNVSAETFSEYKNDDLPKDELLEELKEELKEESLTFPQRRADALVTMAEGYLANPDAGSLKGHERCQLILHVHHNEGAKQGSGSQNNLDSRWLLPDAARRLACDASLLVVEQDGAGNVLDIGRKSRIIPPAMSRALAVRDGGCCQFPGCCESRYVEGHHIKHWADGGETQLDNLVTLCKFHHRELHKGRYFISVKPVSRFNDGSERFAERLCFSTVERYFDSPFSRTEDFVIAPNPAEFTCACCGFDELQKSLPRKIYAGINAKTAVTKWLGDKMDLEMAVDGLLAAGGLGRNQLSR